MAKVESINEKLLDRYIRHAVYIERFKAGEAKKISRHLSKEVFPELIDKLMTKVKATDPSKLKKLWAIRRLRRLTASMDKIIKVGMVKAKESTIDSLMDLAEWEAKWNKGMIERMVPLDIDMSMPNPEVLRQAVLTTPFEGHKLGTWFNAYSKSVRIGMMGAVKKGISAGEDIPSIGRRLRKVTSLKRMQAEYIARTAVSSVVNGAKEAVFLRNKNLIKEVQYTATLDTRTTLVCINLDGQIFVVGRGPRPPMHFNCRSTTIPVISSWKEFGIKAPPPATRASMTGKVPAKMTYKTWLRKQNKATQIKVLGKRRAELYRSGRVKIDRFVGKDYRPLTLKQLARREGLDLRPAPPMAVKAIPTKGTGIKLTVIEQKAIKDYQTGFYEDIRKYQLGKTVPKAQAIKLQIENMESGLSKLPGHTGITYRGLEFSTTKKRAAFLKQFKKGEVWKSKTFQSASTDIEQAQQFAGFPTAITKVKPVMMRIEGVSGRNITKFGSRFGEIEQEVLFRPGTSFKITRVTDHSIYLTEIIKQAQLKITPAPLISPVPLVPTVSKVGTTFAKTTEKGIRDVVTKHIDIYPEKVKAVFNRNGVTYNIGNRLTEMDPRLRGRRPIGWSKGSTWDNVGGVYNIKDKTISIAETYLPRGRTVFAVRSESQLKRMLNHETGHGFDEWAKGFFYSDMDTFRAAYTRDIAKLSKIDIIKNDLRFFMQEGMRGRSETFADIFGDIMGGGAKEGMQKFFPECTKYIESLLK